MRPPETPGYEAKAKVEAEALAFTRLPETDGYDSLRDQRRVNSGTLLTGAHKLGHLTT